MLPKIIAFKFFFPTSKAMHRHYRKIRNIEKQNNLNTQNPILPETNAFYLSK